MTAAPAGWARHRVLIVGGGFAGLYAARNLSSDPEVAVTLLEPYPAGLMQSIVASPLVNSVRNDGPELLAAA